jgi:hypothetical protein
MRDLQAHVRLLLVSHLGATLLSERNRL